MTRHSLLYLISAATIAVGVTSTATAATGDTGTAVSDNWAGYVAGGGATQFSHVNADWTQPSVDCTTGQTNAAFWVGLGGNGGQSGALEQAGTEADCSGDGTPSYFAWYELLPAPPVHLDLAISPGDRVSTAVDVSGSAVTIAVTDASSGASASKTLQMDNPDVSSAEWIAEAPSVCDGGGRCQPQPLSNFGSVAFTNASATANGHTGPVSDPSWSAQATSLDDFGQDAAFSASQPAAGATPSSLDASGSAFSVSWQAPGSQSAGQAAQGSVPDGQGNGYSGAAPGDAFGYGWGDTAPGDGGYPQYGDGQGGWGGAGAPYVYGW